MAGVGEGENAPASSLSLTFLGMCTLLCITVYLFWHPAAIVEYHLSTKMSLLNKYSPLWSSYGKRAKQHAGTGTCREYSLSTVSWCIPANRDEVFSLHADAPSRRLFRCQTHSHCCLNAARLHPAAAPGPLRDPCPGQDPSLPSCVLQTPAVLCGEPRMLLLEEEEDRKAASSVELEIFEGAASGYKFQSKIYLI